MYTSQTRALLTSSDSCNYRENLLLADFSVFIATVETKSRIVYAVISN